MQPTGGATPNNMEPPLKVRRRGARRFSSMESGYYMLAGGAVMHKNPLFALLARRRRGFRRLVVSGSRSTRQRALENLLPDLSNP